MTSTTSDGTIEKLKAIFSDILQGETVPVELQTKRNCMHWDSLNHLKLVVAIEQEFQISLADDEVVDLNSFELAVEIVRAKMGASAS